MPSSRRFYNPPRVTNCISNLARDLPVQMRPGQILSDCGARRFLRDAITQHHASQRASKLKLGTADPSSVIAHSCETRLRRAAHELPLYQRSAARRLVVKGFRDTYRKLGVA